MVTATTRSGRKGVRARLVAVGLVVLFLLFSAIRSEVALADQTVVPTALESWYHVKPTESLAPLPNANPYPPETLHVGIAAGEENSRTYLTLDLSSLPTGASISGGRLNLPVDNASGTVAPETAQMQACLAPVPGTGEGEQGSLNQPPFIDCRIKSSVVHSAAPQPQFIVDLAAFAGQLSTGGIALTPTDEAIASNATWHVAFFGKKNTTAGAAKISASLIFLAPPSSAGSGSSGPSTVSPPSFSSDTVTPFAAPIPAAPSTALFDPSTAPPMAEAPESAAPIPPVRTVADTGPAYLSWVLLVPLALLLFIGYFGRALTFEEEDLEAAAEGSVSSRLATISASRVARA